MGLPKIHEVGKLWRDPELKYTPAGKAVCELGIVFNKRRKTDTGWEDAGSMFVRGTVWEQMAEHCAETLSKGDQVLVSGELSVREFERKDGSKGQSVELRVYDVGPSLKWTQAKLQRVERGSDGDRSTQHTDDPWSTAPADSAPF